jgi:hypothetical protein
MAHGKVKVQRPFSKGIREVAIMGVVEVIVEFKAHTQNTVCDLVASMSSFE